VTIAQHNTAGQRRNQKSTVIQSPALRLPSLPLFTNILAISERFDVLTAKFRVKRMPVREKRKRKEGQSTKLRK